MPHDIVFIQYTRVGNLLKYLCVPIHFDFCEPVGNFFEKMTSGG